jgi:hypothetical protein
LVVPLDELLLAGKRLGGTFNDAYLAAVAQGLAAWKAALGEPVPDEVVALVPRDVRRAEEATTLGNRTWTMLIPLPLSARDPSEAVERVREVTTAAKAQERSAGNAAFQYDIAVSNVRLGGPHEITGAPITEYLVTAPLQGENRLLVVALSYGNSVTLTFTADPDHMVDLQGLAAQTSAAFARLLGHPGER